ncbi:MAG: hypothetical protein ACRDJH_05840 [Thermomicrobiales bacterium]
MKTRARLGMVALPLLTGFGVGVGKRAVTASQASPTAARTPQVFVFSNSSPHVSVIDAGSLAVVQTADIPEFTAWTWNDDNNHAGESELWLGTRNPDTNDVEVITLDLETLAVTHRIPIGQDDMTLYIGKATKEGILNIGKMGAGQVVAIDTATYQVLDTWDVPVNGDVVCDADVTTDGQGRELFVYPTRDGDTVVTIDAATGETVQEIASPSGSRPLMLTTGGDGTVWVQESGSNTNAVYDPELTLLDRFPTGQGPIVNTFSPDGALSYIGYGGDTVVTVIDTETYEEVATVQAGTNPQKIAVNPDGQAIYAILTDEASVAVIDTTTWEVTERVMLGTNPNGIFFRAAS